MTTLKLHFDGWLSLPAHFRQQLALHAGDDLEAELSDDRIVLRAKGSAETVPEGIARDGRCRTGSFGNGCCRPCT